MPPPIRRALAAPLGGQTCQRQPRSVSPEPFSHLIVRTYADGLLVVGYRAECSERAGQRVPASVALRADHPRVKAHNRPPVELAEKCSTSDS